MVADYAGTLLLVSHDRAFLDNVVTSTLVFEGEGRIGEYVGGYNDWLRQRPSAGVAAPIKAAAVVAKAPAREKRAKLSFKEQRELDMLPESIQTLEMEQAELNAAIGDAGFFKDTPQKASAALQRLQQLAQELESAYARWNLLESREA